MSYNIVFKSRLVWVDWAKAILIILVVIGHCGGIFSPLIYSFHIPAFFFISGYLANYDKPDQGKIKSSIGMIKAIIIYNFLFIILNAVKIYFTSDGLSHSNGEFTVEEVLFRPVLGIFFCNYFDYQWTNPLLPQFWFVWVLIFIKFIYRYIFKLTERQLIIISIFCLLYTAVIINLDFHTFYIIDRSLVALPFFILGNLFRKESTVVYKLITINSNRKLCITTILFLLGLLYFWYNIDIHRPDLFALSLGSSALLYYIIALSGTMLLICFIKKMQRNHIIEIISTGTFGILALHLYMLHDILFLEPTRFFATTIILILLYPYILFANKYCPILLGKK